MRNRKLALILIAAILFDMACVCTGTTSLSPATPTPPAPPGASQANPSGIISKLVLAKDVQGDQMEPVNPTNVFAPADTIHAVVAIENAPGNTSFKAIWYAVDVGSSSRNQEIDSTDLASEGTRNLDFSLSPNEKWPAGKYKVEIYVNGNLDQVVQFSVK
ncbi:MAG TPA: hypothetical protein VMT46_17190 [Anaerolineaceae bacterium]|nr:hypothetical protein [Anaerolineaceae bacterium]